MQQLESQSAQPEGRKGAPAAAKERAVPASPHRQFPQACGLQRQPGSDKNYTEGMRLYHAKKYRRGPEPAVTST